VKQPAKYYRDDFNTSSTTSKGKHKKSPKVSRPSTMANRILIVTVTKVEAQAVLKVFSQAVGQKGIRQIIGNKTYYNLGVHGGASVFMVQSEMGTATPGGALLTVRQAIQDMQPQAVIMCGIAFGLHPDKQHLGDILVARQLQYYEFQKVDLKQGQILRGDRATSAERLLDRFRSGDIDWEGTQTHFGLVLSGEKLVNDPTFRGWLLKIEPEAVGGEMLPPVMPK
jgi:nucleoside phosphorylase